MFNQETYLNLLSSIAPKPIESEEEYDYFLAIFEGIFSSEKSKENDAIIVILGFLIESYEKEHYPIPELEPLEFLVGLMDLQELKQKDLVGILGSKGVVSEVINGKREISKAQAKALGQFFNTSYKSFL